MVKITQLPPEFVPTTDDRFVIVDTTSGQTRKVDISEIITLFFTTSFPQQSWIPVWDNLTPGNGVSDSSYIQIGDFIFYRLKFTLGSTSSVGTAPRFHLPVTSINYGANYAAKIGEGSLRDDSGSTTIPGFAYWYTTTIAEINYWVDYTTFVGGNALAASTPWGWTTNDVIQLEGYYRVP